MQKKTAIIITGILGLAGLAYVLLTHDLTEAWEMLKGAPAGLLLAYVGVTIAITTLLVWRWRTIIKALHDDTPSFLELARYYLIGYGVSYITPGAKVGGELFRAGMLSRHCSMRKASSTVFIDRTVEISAMGTFFVLGLAALLVAHALPRGAGPVMIGMGALLIILITTFYYQVFSGNDFIGKLFRLTRLHRTKRGRKLEQDIYDFERYILKFYRKDKQHFFLAVGISLASWALTFVEYWIVLSILGVGGITVLNLFLIITFIGAAYVLPIPMALGTLEAGQVGVFRMIGMPGAAGIGVAIITRAKDVILTILGLSCMGYYGMSLGKDLKEALPFVESEKGKKDKRKIEWDF